MSELCVKRKEPEMCRCKTQKTLKNCIVSPSHLCWPKLICLFSLKASRNYYMQVTFSKITTVHMKQMKQGKKKKNIFKCSAACEFKRVCSCLCFDYISNRVICMKFKCADTWRGNPLGYIHRGPRCHRTITWRHSCRHFWFLLGEAEDPCCMVSVWSTMPKNVPQKNSLLWWHWHFFFKLRMTQPFDTETNAPNSLFTQRLRLQGPLEHWAC